MNKNIDPYEFENGFFHYSKPERLMKSIAHYELYKNIIDLPGSIVECGVFKGNSLIRLATYRQYFENDYSRKIIAFDVFGKFPLTSFEKDKIFRENFIKNAGEVGPTAEEIEKILVSKGIGDNVEFVKGDILYTVKDYIEGNPNLKISLLHIDVDLYEPTKVILENFYPLIVNGGIVVFDDYSIFPGATKAIDDFFGTKQVKKFKGLHTPCFIIK